LSSLIEPARRGAIILCGGKSSRMGQDKASLAFGSETLLRRTVRILAEVVAPEEIVVVGAANQPVPMLDFPVRLTHDQHPEHGPLEGIAAGLRATAPEIDAVYITSCDVPLLKPSFVAAMFDSLWDHDVAVPFDNQHVHPLAAVYRTSVLPWVEKLLAENQRSPRQLFPQVSTCRISVDDLRAVDQDLVSLLNVNTPDDYQRALLAAGLT
jgi:molybdopterin-guanine dinucleotide biosynthesis protein A